MPEDGLQRAYSAGPGALAASARPNRRGTDASLPAAGPAASVALYATPSYSSLYVEPEDLEPGPGTYDVAGGFGHQQLSTNHSYPSSSLTAKHDRSWAKAMITKDHLNVLMARGTPGPGTYEPEGAQTQARVRFGTAKRRGLSDTKFRAPGPVYEVLGEPDNPVAQTKFGKASRFDWDSESSLSKALGSTGPGQYEMPTIFDGANLAKSFGASHRAYDRVRFPGSERMEIGRASCGPGAAQPFMNSGRSSSFSRAERLPGNSAKRSPGPGAYDNHERPCPASRSQSVYSFGRPHPKGRINWRQMQYLNNSVFGIN